MYFNQAALETLHTKHGWCSRSLLDDLYVLNPFQPPPVDMAHLGLLQRFSIQVVYKDLPPTSLQQRDIR